MNSDKEVYEDKINFKYKKSNQYQEFHASGVYGGLQPRGEFKMDFFTEKYELPDSRVMDPDTGQWIDSNDRNNKFVRELQTGVFMNPEEAFSIAAWIIANIFELPTEEVEKDLLKKYKENSNK